MFKKIRGLQIPKIGLRKIKSLIAVTVAFLIWQPIRLLVPLPLDIHPLFGYIYAIIEMRESVEKTKEFGKLRIKATFIGLAFGLLILPLSSMSNSYFGVGLTSIIIDLLLILLGVIITLWTAEFFKCKNFCGIAAIIFVICLVRDKSTDINIYFYAILRTFQTLIGIFSAYFVNSHIFKKSKGENNESNGD